MRSIAISSRQVKTSEGRNVYLPTTVSIPDVPERVSDFPACTIFVIGETRPDGKVGIVTIDARK
jgi:hypothetical protein